MVLGNSGTTNKNIKTKIELCRTQITSHKGIVGISHEVKIFLCSLRWSAQGEGDSSFVNLSTRVPQFNKMSPQSNCFQKSLLQVTRMVPKAPTNRKSALYYKCGLLRKKIGPFLVWGEVGFSEGLTEWVSTTWTWWWTAPCRSMTRRWVTRSLPSQRSMRGKLRGGRQ